MSPSPIRTCAGLLRTAYSPRRRIAGRQSPAPSPSPTGPSPANGARNSRGFGDELSTLPSSAIFEVGDQLAGMVAACGRFSSSARRSRRCPALGRALTDRQQLVGNWSDVGGEGKPATIPGQRRVSSELVGATVVTVRRGLSRPRSWRGDTGLGRDSTVMNRWPRRVGPRGIVTGRDRDGGEPTRRGQEVTRARAAVRAC